MIRSLLITIIVFVALTISCYAQENMPTLTNQQPTTKELNLKIEIAEHQKDVGAFIFATGLATAGLFEIMKDSYFGGSKSTQNKFYKFEATTMLVGSVLYFYGNTNLKKLTKSKNNSEISLEISPYYYADESVLNCHVGITLKLHF